MNYPLRRTLLAGIAYLLAVPSALAQDDSSGAPVETSALHEVLDEVIVTATRREERLQDVAVSVNVVSGDFIQQFGFSDMEDLSVFVPNLFMWESAPGGALYIRGIGAGTSNGAFEQPVSTFHDGVYYGRDNLSQLVLFDTAQVEVVRGPQPVFAGQSATAGAIRYASRRPGDEFDGTASVSFSSKDESNAELGVGGPLTDTFGLRFAARYYDFAESGYTNVATGDDVATVENAAYRITGVWAPIDTFELMLKFESHDIFQQGVIRDQVRCEVRPEFSSGSLGAPGMPAGCALEAAYFGGRPNGPNDRVGLGAVPSVNVYDAIRDLNAASGAVPGDPNFWVGVNINGNPTTNFNENLTDLAEFNKGVTRDQTADIATLSFDWDIGGNTLSAQTSYIEYVLANWNDPDATAFAIFHSSLDEDFEQWAQEIRLTSSADRDFRWMVGAYWQEHDFAIRQISYFRTAFGSGNDIREDSTWKSLFFTTEWNLTDEWRLNVGARYQDVEKVGDFHPYARLPNAAFDAFGPDILAPPLTGFVSETDDILPEVSVQWNASDTTMVYLKYAEAFKAGGFVFGPAPGGNLPPQLVYEPEFAESFELGLKSRLLDDTLELNVAAFHTDVADLQVSAFDPVLGAVVTQNAASINMHGVEIDGRWAISDSFLLGFSGTLGDAEYEDWPGQQCNTLENKLWNLNNPMDPGGCSAANNAGGQPLTFFSDWTMQLAPTYSFNLGQNLQGTFTVNAVFGDGFPTDPNRDPIAVLDDFERVDAALKIGSEDDSWSVSLFGRNLTDDRVLIQAALFGRVSSATTDLDYDGAGGFPAQRARQYGVQFNYRLDAN